MNFRIIFIVLCTYLLNNGAFCALAKPSSNTLMQSDSSRVVLIIDSLLQTDFNIQGYDSAVKAYDRAYALSVQYKYQSRQALSLFNLGFIQNRFGYHTQALENLLPCLTLYEAQENSLGIAKCQRQIGNAYFLAGENDQATNYFLIAIGSFKKIDNPRELAASFNSLAGVYDAMGFYDKAIGSFHEALALASDVDILSVVLSNIFLTYIRLENYDSALFYLDKGLTVCNQDNDEYCFNLFMRRKIMLYNQMNELDSAIKYSNTVAEYYERMGMKQDLVIAYSQLGIMHMHMEHYEKSYEYLYKSAQLAREQKFDQTPRVLGNLAMVSAKLGRYQEAYEALSENIQIRDSVDKATHGKEFEDLLAKYETEKKEQEIALLQKENEFKAVVIMNQQNEFEKERLGKSIERQNRENKIDQLRNANELQQASLLKERAEKRQKESEIALLNKEKQLAEAENYRQIMIRRFVTIAFVLVIILAVIMLIFYRQKAAAAKLLAIRTKELNERETEAIQQENQMKQIKAYLEGQEQERLRIAKDLHDGVAGNLAGIKLSLEGLVDNYLDERSFMQLKNSLDTTYWEVKSISNNLSPIKGQETSFVQFVSNYIEEIGQLHNIKVEINESLSSNLSDLDDQTKLEIYRVLQELMNNVVKHAQAQVLELSFSELDGQINIMAEDDGLGFDINGISKGMGLENMNQRIELLGGNIDIDSRVGRGTIININIPLNGLTIKA